MAASCIFNAWLMKSGDQDSTSTGAIALHGRESYKK